MSARFAKANTATTTGLAVHAVTAEADLSPGLHSFAIVGLPDKAVEEAKERVNAAVKNSGAKEPRQHNRRLVINLAPAEIKKQGSSFDFPIAVAFLAASEQISTPLPEDFLFLGELALDGALRRVHGVLPVARFARESGKVLIIPEDNEAEASLVRDLKFVPVASLRDFIQWYEAPAQKRRVTTGRGIVESLEDPEWDFDFAFIHGQTHAKRALEIVAAGRHPVRFSGPPGSGKTLLARSVPSILPPLSEAEALETTSIWSVAGMISQDHPLLTAAPFRNPHHTSTAAAIIGGGANIRPGEVSLAHRGVLFLDEFPEFSRNVIEALRQPLEEGFVTISRAQGAVTFPANFMLIAAQNPCPCGHFGDEERPCVCSPGQVVKYQRKISGPILDRIDLTVHIRRLKSDAMLLDAPRMQESSHRVRQRVVAARQVQKERFRAYPNITTNSDVPGKLLTAFVPIDAATKTLLGTAIDKLQLSPRAVHRLLRVTRTIADLAGSEKASGEHLAEALQYRYEQMRE